MTSRLTTIALTLSLASGGCVTTTAHQLVLVGNPLREQAVACEQRCKQLSAPAPRPCEQMFGGESCTPPPDLDAYASCLDNCPGSRAKDGASCPDPPVADVICVETTRANGGAIAGASVGGGALILTVIILSSPFLLLTLLILAH